MAPEPHSQPSPGTARASPNSFFISTHSAPTSQCSPITSPSLCSLPEASQKSHPGPPWPAPGAVPAAPGRAHRAPHPLPVLLTLPEVSRGRKSRVWITQTPTRRLLPVIHTPAPFPGGKHTPAAQLWDKTPPRGVNPPCPCPRQQNSHGMGVWWQELSHTEPGDPSSAPSWI